MKKITLLLLLLITGFSALAQVSTTEEEYNYLTQGYELALETGQDLKTGYELQEFNDFKVKDYQYTFSYFIDLETKKVNAVLIVAKKIKSGKDKVQYLCMPINNKKLFAKYLEEKSKNITMSEILDQYMHVLLSMAINQIKN